MTQPTQSDVHVETALTNMSLAVLQSTTAFVAPQVFRTLSVPKANDKYFTYDRSFFTRNEVAKRAPGTRANSAGWELSTDSYSCDPWALQTPVAWEVEANADAVLNMAMDAQTLLTHQMLLSQEINWASTFFTTTVWGTDITGVSGTPGSGETLQWNDETSTPIEDVRAGIEAVRSQTGIKPNTLVMGEPVLSQLLDHPDIIARFNGGATMGNPAITTEDIIARILGVDRLIVGGAIKNTAGEGLTASYSDILGKAALLVYVPPAPSARTPAAGYTFRWSGFLGGTNDFGFVIDSWDEVDKMTTWYRAHAHYDHKVTSTALGYFFATIVA